MAPLLVGLLFLLSDLRGVSKNALQAKKADLRQLKSRLEKMEQEKLFALQAREDLKLRIASQNDPAWIEMILMRDLGVVPEGFQSTLQKMIFFLAVLISVSAFLSGSETALFSFRRSLSNPTRNRKTAVCL